VILETLKAEGKAAEAQMAWAYGVYPVNLAKWKHHLLEHGTKVFGGKMAGGGALHVKRAVRSWGE